MKYIDKNEFKNYVKNILSRGIVYTKDNVIFKEYKNYSYVLLQLPTLKYKGLIILPEELEEYINNIKLSNCLIEKISEIDSGELCIFIYDNNEMNEIEKNCKILIDYLNVTYLSKVSLR